MELGNRITGQVVLDHIDAYGDTIQNILADLRATYINEEPYPINLPNTCEMCLGGPCSIVAKMFLCGNCTFMIMRDDLYGDPHMPVTVERVRDLHSNRPLILDKAISSLACARVSKLAHVVAPYKGKCAICQRGNKTLTSYLIRGINIVCIRSICDDCNDSVNATIELILNRASYLLCVSKRLHLDNAEIHVSEFLVALMIKNIRVIYLKWLC